MSLANLDPAYTGISCPRNVVGLGLHLTCRYLRPSSQFRINFSSWSFKPGLSLALSLHFPRPRCLSWMRLRLALHFLCGTTIWVPFKTIPSSTVYLAWHFSDGAWPSMDSCMLEEHKFIIFLHGNPYFIQAVTSCM